MKQLSANPLDIDYTPNAPLPTFTNAGALIKSAGNTTNIAPRFVNSDDIVNVAGIAQLAGTRDLSMLNGFIPQPGDRFTILTYASHQGEFEHIIGQDLPAETGWTLFTGPTRCN